MRNATGVAGEKLMYLPHFVSKNHMGGGEVLVLESNQNHARAEDTEVCPCLPAAMGNWGGYVPMILTYGFDARCKWVTKEKSQTVTATGGGRQLRLFDCDIPNRNRNT